MTASKPLIATTLLLVLASAQSAQRRGRETFTRSQEENRAYNGQFVFTRIRYGTLGGWGGRGGPRWSHDYPRADRHLPKILDEITTVDADLVGSNVYDLDDPEMFRFPLIYISEPGFWTMSDAEALGLREYLLKGGFAIFDDFEREREWENFEAQMRRVLPDHHPVEIGRDHPIFHSFFDIKNIDIPHPLVPVHPKYYGMFEDNTPAGRMMAIVNFNNDLAEYWEWSGTGLFPVDTSNEAYKFGINYVVYAMTH
jgi:uncharacterized protein DUF4159